MISDRFGGLHFIEGTILDVFVFLPLKTTQSIRI